MPNTRTAARHELFCAEYIKDLNATQAAIRAGYSANGARGVGYELLKLPDVQERIAVLQAERAARTGVNVDDVVRELAHIALADHNELIELRRTCCRHCHGIEHRYQYKTQGALDSAVRAFSKTTAALTEEFEHGGIGFNATLEPHPECPECHGEGEVTVHAKDTRTLSPAARSLYAGLKVTRDGIEIKTHTKEKALELLGRHLGMFTDKLEMNGDLAKAILDARNRSS